MNLSRKKSIVVFIGKAYCEARQPWPHAESITVKNDLAIICLANESPQKKNIAVSVESLSIYSNKGDLKTVKLLLDAGVDVNAQDSRGSRALIEASWAGKQDVALSLIEHGTNPNFADTVGSTPLAA